MEVCGWFPYRGVNATGEKSELPLDERSAFTAFGFDEIDDFLQGCAGGEDRGYAATAQLVGIFGRDRAAAEKHDVGRTLRLQLFDDERKERHVRAGENREPNTVGIFLNGRLHDLLRSLK